MSLPAEFQSLNAFQSAFTAGLERMLAEHRELGVFILVLANSVMDEELRARLGAALGARFASLRANTPEAAPDDTAVFEALRDMSLDHFSAVRRRQLGGFEMQLNELRGLRPARGAGARVETLYRPFDASGFHFAKPFLRREIFWQGELLGRDIALLYNKFPFLPWHGLLVPEIDAGHAQFLTEAWHHDVWDLTARLGETLPGVGFGYNAMGAYSSVNHLHLQMFVRTEPLPVAATRWRHNGGDQAYPTDCIRCDDAASAWQTIAGLHAAGATYNLIYLPGRLYCLPRRFQGTYPAADWNGGYAFYEMAGGLTVFRRELFDTLGTEDLDAELRRTASGFGAV